MIITDRFCPVCNEVRTYVPKFKTLVFVGLILVESIIFICLASFSKESGDYFSGMINNSVITCIFVGIIPPLFYYIAMRGKYICSKCKSDIGLSFFSDNYKIHTEESKAERGKCLYCGTVNDPTDKYCLNCGKSLK